MKKIYSVFMSVALFAISTTTITAADPTVSLDFTQNDWSFPVGSANAARTLDYFTNTDGYTVEISSTKGYYYDPNGYLVLGTTNSVLTLPRFNFDVERIDVVGHSEASTATQQNIWAGATPASTTTTGVTGTNQYDIDPQYQSAGNLYSLIILSDGYSQITAIHIYQKGSTTALNQPLAEGIFFDGSVIRNAAGLNLAVYTVNGQLVKTSAENIDMSAMPNGVYLVRSANAVLKIVK